MQQATLMIPTISCDHCVAAIERELKLLPGVVRVKGHAVSRQIEVIWELPASIDLIKKTLAEINYPAA